MTKYIVVTGGVLSGLGKGLAAASIGKLLSSEYKIVPIKCDGYLNVDPGTMNPIEHGEVYVLEDGTEVDMDFGHYERYLGVECKGEWNLTMGKVYDKIRRAERRGDYLGKTVRMVPDVTKLILTWWKDIARKERADVVILEIGGTVGDIESEMFIESVRRLRNSVGSDNFFHVHVTYVPVLFGSGELKSKPTQSSNFLLRQRGLVPDLVIGRCAKPLSRSIKRKIAEDGDISQENVVSGVDTENLFTIPLNFKNEGVDTAVSEGLGVKLNKKISEYEGSVKKMNESRKEVKVAICGKYTGIDDSYASVINSLKMAGADMDTRCRIDLIETTDIENGASNVEEINKRLSLYDGVIVPGGFGERGVEGKIQVIKYCRENNVPFLGLCYGLQLAVVEFARNVCGLDGANTTEADPETKHAVVKILPEKEGLENLGGTLRLGAYPTELKPRSKVRKLYGKRKISERHRHRYEINPKYHARLEKGGMVFSGMSPDGRLVECIELPEHPFFVGTQAHPEFKYPAPLFVGFMSACVERS